MECTFSRCFFKCQSIFYFNQCGFCLVSIFVIVLAFFTDEKGFLRMYIKLYVKCAIFQCKVRYAAKIRAFEVS